MDNAEKILSLHSSDISDPHPRDPNPEGKERRKGIQVACGWNRLKASMMLLVTSQHLVLRAELLLMCQRIVPQQPHLGFVYLKWPNRKLRTHDSQQQLLFHQKYTRNNGACKEFLLSLSYGISDICPRIFNFPFLLSEQTLGTRFENAIVCDY